jgi:hypothetical protein
MSSAPEHEQGTSPETPDVEITLSTGEPARLVAFDGVHLEAVTPRPFAPGARALFRVGFSDSVLAIDLKCHGSKRTEDGAFHVKGRVISLPKEARDRLLALVAMLVNR